MPRRFLYPRAASPFLFPTVPHLAGSAAGPGDVVFDAAQTEAFLASSVRVFEKLDGVNVGLRFTRRGALRFVSRVHGVLPPARLGVGLWPLVDWAFERLPALLDLLGAERVLYGEWLRVPRRLPYPRSSTDFVAFALHQRGRGFLSSAEVGRRVLRAGLSSPPVLRAGRAASVDELARLCRTSTFGGPAEGVVVETADGRWAKWVRADWEARPVRAPPRLELPRLERPGGRGRFAKRFDASRATDAENEAEVLETVAPLGLAPRLLAKQRDANGDQLLVLERVEGAEWPTDASPVLAAALGRQLGRLHGAFVERPALKGAAATHALTAARTLARAGSPDVARAVSERLVPFLRVNLADLDRPVPVLCHGDLKPENLRVRGSGVWLLDFERARLADAAWELACAMDRLRLDAAGRCALVEGWATERHDANVMVRAQLFRLAWQVALRPAVRSLEAETGRRPSTRAVRLADEAWRKGVGLLAALARFRR